MVEFTGGEAGSLTIGAARAETICDALEAYIEGNSPAERIVLAEKTTAIHNELIANQVRIVLRNCGKIDPESLDEYIAAGGYEALKKALPCSRKRSSRHQGIWLERPRRGWFFDRAEVELCSKSPGTKEVCGLQR